MLSTTLKVVENFEKMTKEEQIKYLNECTIPEIEVLNEAGYDIEIVDGKVVDFNHEEKGKNLDQKM